MMLSVCFYYRNKAYNIYILCAGAGQLTDLSGHKEVRMQAKVGVFGRGMASVKIQYFVEGQLYGLFKVTCEAKPFCQHYLRHLVCRVSYFSVCIMRG